ncbi:MAG: MFS transporter [Candidatus Buchananbacteria bacterium]|nr:MFS transporter [Candidatus Buchananbacteria bacterium]
MFDKKTVGKIIRTLIISDFFLFFAVGLLAPIFAVYILENIENRLEVIGYAVSCYWITRVIMVIPLSRVMDNIKGEFDEYFFMIIGTFLISAIPLFYIIASAPWHIYVLQIINGFAHSMAVPAWRIVFTNNVDKSIVGFEWSLEDVGVGIATASSAAIGAIVADRFGFNVLFGLIFLFGTISSLILLTLNKSKQSILRSFLGGQTHDKGPLKIDTFK